MNKKLIGALTAAGIFAAAYAQAGAAESNDASTYIAPRSAEQSSGAVIDGANMTEIIVTSDAASASLTLADYDSDGRLNRAQTREIELLEGENTYSYEAAGFETDKISAGSRAFLWERGTMKPLAQNSGIIEELRTGIVLTYLNDKIYFSSSDIDSFRTDYTDCEYTFSGAETTPSNLREGDVLSIFCIGTNGGSSSPYYRIIVSRNTADEVFSHYNEESGEYVFESGNAYKAAYDGACDLTKNRAYTLRLDAFGSIAGAEELCEPMSSGILENIYISEDGVCRAEIITASGRRAVYETEDSDAYEKYVIFGENGEKRFISERIISYRLTESGKLFIGGFERADYCTYRMYDSGAKTLGAFGIGDDTVMLDITDYYSNDVYNYLGQTTEESALDNIGDVRAVSAAELSGTNLYASYAFMPDSAKNKYRLVLITDALPRLQRPEEPSLSFDRVMGVYISEEPTVYEGTDAVLVNMLYYGKKRSFYLMGAEPSGLQKGDAFFFALESRSIIDRSSVKRVFKNEISLSKGYDTFYNNALSMNFDVIDDTVKTLFPSWNKYSGSDEDCELVFGPVVSIGENSVTIAGYEPESPYMRTDGSEYNISPLTYIYEYDYGERSGYEENSLKLILAETPELPEGLFVNYGGFSAADKVYADFGNGVLTENMSASRGGVAFALVSVICGEVNDVLLITPSAK